MILRIIRPGRMALRIVGTTRQQLREPMFGIGRPRAERHKSTMWLFTRRRPQCRHHALASRLRPLCRFVGQYQHWRKPVRPARVAPDAADASAGLPIFDPGLLRRIPHSPAALVFELRAHERDYMLEGDPRLFEARSDDDGLAAPYCERAVERRRCDPRQQRGLAVATRDRQGGRLDLGREGVANEATLPGQDGEGLPGPTPLGDPSGRIGIGSRPFMEFGTPHQRSSRPQGFFGGAITPRLYRCGRCGRCGSTK